MACIGNFSKQTSLNLSCVQVPAIAKHLKNIYDEEELKSDGHALPAVGYKAP